MTNDGAVARAEEVTTSSDGRRPVNAPRDPRYLLTAPLKVYEVQIFILPGSDMYRYRVILDDLVRKVNAQVKWSPKPGQCLPRAYERVSSSELTPSTVVNVGPGKRANPE